jgi:hypothetical protein
VLHNYASDTEHVRDNLLLQEVDPELAAIASEPADDSSLIRNGPLLGSNLPKICRLSTSCACISRDRVDIYAYMCYITVMVLLCFIFYDASCFNEYICTSISQRV